MVYQKYENSFNIGYSIYILLYYSIFINYK